MTDKLMVKEQNLPRAQLMVHAAEMLSKDKELAADLENYQKANEYMRNQVAWVIYDDLMRIAGEEIIAEWPDPDTDRSMSNKPDIILIPSKTGGKASKESFYFRMADQMSMAVPIVKRLEEMSKAKDNIPAADYKSETSLLRQRLGGIRNAVKTGVKMIKQFHAIENMGKVTCTVLKAKDDPNTVRNVPRPIYLIDKDDPSAFKDVSVGTFLRYNVPKAIENGGTLAALIATAKSGGGGGGEGKKVELKDAKDLSDFFSDVNHFTALKGNRGKIITAISSDEGADIATNLYKVWSFLDDLMGVKIKGGETVLDFAEASLGMTSTAGPQSDAA